MSRWMCYLGYPWHYVNEEPVKVNGVYEFICPQHGPL